MKNCHENEKPVSTGHSANMDGVAAVERALAIAEALEVARRPLTLKELAAHTGFYKSTILRLLVSLERRSLVVRRSDQSYILGPFATRLGKAYEACLPLEATLLPLMQELVQQGMESPSFHAIHDAQTRICILRLDSLHSTLDRVRVGDKLPLNAGAPGKVLSHRSADAYAFECSNLLRASFGERDPSCAAIAGPVFGPGQSLLGALSLSGPLDRFHAQTIQNMAPKLLVACQRATEQLGGSWPEAL